jgi:hypothetical protein
MIENGYFNGEDVRLDGAAPNLKYLIRSQNHV